MRPGTDLTSVSRHTLLLWKDEPRDWAPGRAEAQHVDEQEHHRDSRLIFVSVPVAKV